MLKLWPAFTVSIFIVSYGEIYLRGNYSLYHIVGLLTIWLFNAWIIKFNYMENISIDINSSNEDRYQLLASEVSKSNKFIENELIYMDENIESLKGMVSDASAELFMEFSLLSESLKKQGKNIEDLMKAVDSTINSSISVGLDNKNSSGYSVNKNISEIRNCNVSFDKHINNLICILQFEDVVNQLCLHTSGKISHVIKLLSDVNIKLTKHDGADIKLSDCIDVIRDFNESMNSIKKNDHNLSFNSGLRDGVDKSKIDLF